MVQTIIDFIIIIMISLCWFNFIGWLIFCVLSLLLKYQFNWYGHATMQESKTENKKKFNSNRRFVEIFIIIIYVLK